MKKFVFTIVLLATNASYADYCRQLFDEANSAASIAIDFGKNAEKEFKSMKRHAKDNATNERICGIGRDTRMLAFLSAKNFKKSRAIWLDAINACQSPNDETAADQADSNTISYNTQAEFVASMDNLLGSRCGFKPLTPVLNDETK